MRKFYPCSYYLEGTLILLNRENLKYESQICLPMPIKSQMFGVPLDAIMGYEGEKDGLPRVVRDCIQYLRETGMQRNLFVLI